ncbi:MAG: hypothetical protein M0017_09165, partial [Desulfobacteraceae bacterium]|nr:hypothetical protein [Desulfobacteraceae bacterium]
RNLSMPSPCPRSRNPNPLFLLAAGLLASGLAGLLPRGRLLLSRRLAGGRLLLGRRLGLGRLLLLGRRLGRGRLLLLLGRLALGLADLPLFALLAGE